MAKLKSQKEKDLNELTEKLKTAKSVVMTGYLSTTVADLDKFRNALRKENVFSKVYKIPLIKKAIEASGVQGTLTDYKTPVILSISETDETTPARVIKGLAKEVKTFSILEGLVDGKIMSKDQVNALADLPSKDQLRAQFMSVLNGPMSAFARVLNAYSEKLGKPVEAPAQAEASSSAEAMQDKPAAPEAPAAAVEAAPVAA